MISNISIYNLNVINFFGYILQNITKKTTLLIRNEVFISFENINFLVDVDGIRPLVHDNTQ